MFIAIVLVVIVLLGAYAIWIRSLATTQVTVRANADLGTVRNAVDGAFNKLIWERVSGPGDYNFRPRGRKLPPILSVSITTEGQGACSVDLWPSSYATVFGIAMNHATLTWRKNRAVARRLAAL